jgi:outer membrane protein TolC
LAATHPAGKCKLLSPCDSRAWELRRTILFFAAQDDRNRSAGQALQMFFKAAELEAQIGLLQLAHDDLIGAIKKSDEMTKKGLRLPTDPSTLRRQLLDTDAELTRARAGLVEVNGRLKELIGATDLCPDDWIWPVIEVPVTFEGVDADAAVRLALEKRPELNLLREICGNLDAQTLPVVREYLHGISGLMAASSGPTKHIVATMVALKAILSGNSERSTREKQIADLLADRERAVAEEVRRSVADLHAKARLVALSRERVLSADERRRDAEQKAERAGGSFLEVLTARLDWYKARNQLTTDVMAWHTARARVREAQGLFVWECCGAMQP